MVVRGLFILTRENALKHSRDYQIIVRKKNNALMKERSSAFLIITSHHNTSHHMRRWRRKWGEARYDEDKTRHNRVALEATIVSFGITTYNATKFELFHILKLLYLWNCTFVDTASSLLNKFGQTPRNVSLMASVDALSSR